MIKTNRSLGENRWGTQRHYVQTEEFILHPFGGMYWEKRKILFISDTHFGKVMHFRKSGIAVPKGAINENWVKLDQLITFFRCKEVVILGDLFHSEYNVEWELFSSLMNTYDSIRFSLVLGNHDILEAELYTKAGIDVYETLLYGDLLFSHHPMEVAGKYNIHGHIHPAVLMGGKGMGKTKVPCFFFGAEYGIMPAFGAFTGTARVPVSKEDSVYVLVGDQVISVE